MKKYFGKEYAGEWMIATAGLHTVIGLLVGTTQFAAIAKSGFFNAIDPHFDRMAIFWFLSYGFLLLLIGGMMRWAQQQTGRQPSWLAWFLWGMAIPSVILMPLSGLWLLFPLGWLAYDPTPPVQEFA
ncbi:MAG: DUF6463 family protein [Anaerolineae bacterium]